MSKSRKHRKTYKYVPISPAENLLLYDVPRVAGALCISIWAARTLIWAGKLQATKIGHKLLVRREELEKFVAEQGGAR